jgi:N-acetylmuramoyl-L-alanine amidase
MKLNRNLILVFKLLLIYLFSSRVFAQDSSIVIYKAKEPFIIVLDPGHGGRDPGKPKGGKHMKHEKELNLLIAQKVGKYIQERIEGSTVVYTRYDDTFVTLDERVEIANKKKADYFLSIHCNSSPVFNVQGIQLHIQDYDFPQSLALAEAIEKEFTDRARRRSRGILGRQQRGYNYQVLQYTEMPGVLIEAGFMTNPQEAEYLNNDWGQDILASAIFRGFRSFLQNDSIPTERTRREYYKVQIQSSPTQLNLEHRKFKKLKMRIDEIYQPNRESAYKFRYMVGREYDKAAAEKLLLQVRSNGFTDAFIVKFDPTVEREEWKGEQP